MHQLGIAHRDIKVENILRSTQDGRYKLCDFGSASTDTLDYTQTSKSLIAKQIEIFERQTTLMYRPPEMLDQYQGYKVDLKVDIWMLGCVLYALSFGKHPFQDSQTLAIMNASYQFPEESTHISEKMRDLIRAMLTPNPEKRPTIWELDIIVSQFDKLSEIPLSEESLQIKKRQEEAASVRTARKPKVNSNKGKKEEEQKWQFSHNQG